MKRPQSKIQTIVYFLVFLFLISTLTTNHLLLPHNLGAPIGNYLGIENIYGENLNSDQKYRMIILFRYEADVIRFINSNNYDVSIISVYKIIPAILVLATPLQAKQISMIEGVIKIWLDQKVNYLPKPEVEVINIPTESTLKAESDGIDFNLTKIHEKYNGTNVIVAVLDTGIDPTHPDLNDLDDDETTNESKVITGVSFVEMEPYYWGDFNGHGTYVAGIIAGTGNASGGAVRGVAPGAMLMNVKVLASTGEAYQSWIISGIEYAVNHGADIIAMCFSGPGMPGDPVCRAIDAAIEYGVVVVTSAGDEGPTYSSIGSPGMAYSAITVGNYNQFQGFVAENSSRGPNLDLRIGPDLIAPGVAVISCRVNTTANPLDYEIADFGTPINESYTNASGSFAAAAFVAGACAILIQAFQLLDPIGLKFALQKNADDIGVNPNAQGLGVIDIYKTFNYLNQTYGEDELISNRIYTPALPYLGYIGTENLTILDFLFDRKISINCSIGSYADFGILTFYNKTNDFNASHFLFGRFGVRYNNQDVKWFSEMRVLREMHHILRGFYDRSVSILTDDTLLYTILIESWDFVNSTEGNNSVINVNGFKISIIINNLLNTPIMDLSVVSWWKMDLFYNETNYAKDDFGGYNNIDDIIYVNDTYESTDNAAYVGLKATIATAACEIGPESDIYDDLIDDNLKDPNFQSFSGEDLGIATKWDVGDLSPNQNIVFSGSLGLGMSYTDLKNQLNWILNNSFIINVTDLVVCDFNTSIYRMFEVGNPLNSDILVINAGTLPIDNITTRVMLNSSNFDFSLTFTNLSLQPHQIQTFSASIFPLTTGIYNFSWYSINTTYGDIAQEITYEEAIKRDSQPLDNIFSRNLFIYQRKFIDLANGTLISPYNLTCEPFLVRMPGDSIKYNLTFFSNSNIQNLSLEVSGNASKYITITPEFIDTPGTYSFIGVEFSIPIFIEPGFYNACLKLTMNSTFSKDVPISFIILNYSKILGRILFDTSHGAIGSLGDWDERLDSIYANYFEFYKFAESNFYNVDELPYGTTITSDIVAYYDTVIICDPERGYNSSEIEALQDYINAGGSVFIWAENADECNISTLNSIINEYGLNISEFYIEGIFRENLTVSNHKITQGIDSIELYNPVNLSASGQAIRISDHIALINSSDDTNSKILLLGDSDLFSNAYLSSQNNSELLLTSFQWLISDTLKMDVHIYSNYSSNIIYLGEKVHISINVLVPNGSKSINSKAFLAASIIFPNGTPYYNYFSFYLRDGWHSMFFLTDIANQSGWYSIIIFVQHTAGVSFYNTSIPTFYVNASKLIKPPGEQIEPPPKPYFPPLVGFLGIWGLLFILVGIWIADILKLNKKIKKVK